MAVRGSTPEEGAPPVTQGEGPEMSREKRKGDWWVPAGREEGTEEEEKGEGGGERAVKRRERERGWP